MKDLVKQDESGMVTPVSQVPIIIVDDHPLFRQGIRMALEKTGRYHVVGEARNGAELMTLLQETECAAVTLDLKMPQVQADNHDRPANNGKADADLKKWRSLTNEYAGLLALQNIKQYWPAVKALVITEHAKRDLISYVFELGVDGYALKEEIGDDLAQVLDRMLAGQKTFSKKVQDILAHRFASGATAGLASLSDREIEVLECIASGLKDKEIAERLEIARVTVSYHKRNIKDKLDVDTTGELIAYYLTNI